MAVRSGSGSLGLGYVKGSVAQALLTVSGYRLGKVGLDWWAVTQTGPDKLNTLMPPLQNGLRGTWNEWRPSDSAAST